MCILFFTFFIFYFETFMLKLFISNQQPVCSFRGPFCLLAHFSSLNSSIPFITADYFPKLSYLGFQSFHYEYKKWIGSTVMGNILEVNSWNVWLIFKMSSHIDVFKGALICETWLSNSHIFNAKRQFIINLKPSGLDFLAVQVTTRSVVIRNSLASSSQKWIRLFTMMD